MRFLSIAIARVDETAGWVPNEQYLAEMEKLLDELTRAGALLDIGGLRPTREGVRLRWNKGKLTKRDGPFTEAKEVIGGYGVFSANSLEEATALATRFLALHGDEGNVECEIRQIEEPDARG